MVMDDAAGAQAFHESASHVQLPIYEMNASMMSRLLPRNGTVLDLGSGSGQLARHLATGRPDVTVTCVDLSVEMLRLGREMAAARGLDRLSFVAADVRALADEVVGTPDLVCCNWTLHQLPDRDTAVGVLGQIARIRNQHGSAVWIYDFARLRRDATMPAFFDTFNGSGYDRVRTDAVASEAAAWTVEEMRAMLTDAGLAELQCAQSRPLGLYQAWWVPNTQPIEAVAWVRPPMSDDVTYWADRTIAGMNNLPPG
jgi:tRNA (cmo5U34)-methyltransferase